MDWKVLIGSKILLLTLISTSVIGGNEDKKVVCYYTNWSVYRPGTAKFSPQNINPYLCTHLIYAFGGFTKDNTLKPFDKYQDIDKGGYAKFTGLKTYNKDLKTLLAIGGWNEASSRFSPMVADPQRRRQFVKSVVKFLRQNHFDGLDLDWEYPAFRDGGKPRDKDNYASFVQELREEFEKESSKTGRPRLLLTMAVPAGIEYIDKGYNIPKLNQYLDFINLLSYDYHSAYEPAVNHHSPLYPLEEDNEYNYDNELTIDYTIKHLIKSGASPEKIIMGIPTYGRSYTLFNEDAYTLGSPADGPGAEGDATREKGYLAYYEICESIENDDWVVEKPNPTAMGPYAYKNNQWVGYDDEDIVRVKAKYVNEKNLGGIMFWSIDNDDFRGKCHGRSYPLIEAAKEALFEENGIQKEDERSNTNGSRKRNRISVSSKSSSQLNSRKSNGVINRKNTLSRPSSEKRLSTSSSSKFRNRFNSKTTDDLNEENNENSDDVISTRTTNKSTRTRLLANKNRSKTRSNIGDRDDRKKQLSSSTSTHKSSNNKITTPEPPTTPDPGSDFKCEDEGFFSHPRDCKKYFWCLDSGPSGLGIVANQFTCPSGLVFNKVADSCDYPRNVICPKMKAASTTTERTTTEKEEDEIIGDDEEEDDFEDDIEEDEEDDIIENKKLEQEKPKKVSTTVRPLLYKTINRSRPTTTSTTTTTTTTLATTSGPVKLAEDVSEEQDPRVIKELIDLIKKAGGIEQLEKQLALQEKTVVSGSTQGNGQVTPATISKSLYERVLNRQSSKSNLLGLSASRLSSRKNDETENKDDNEQTEIKISNKPASNVKFLNGPGRSQFEGLDEVPEVKSLRRSNKPKYVTIERHSSLTTSTKIDEELDEEDDEADEDEDNEDVASSEEKQISDVPEDKVFPTQRSTPGYVNIRRTRPTTTTEKSRVNTDIKEVNSIANEEQSQTHHSVRRTSFRPTEYTTKEKVEESTTPKARYISINRFRSTTITPRTASDQINTERFSTKPVTIDGYNEKPVPEEKTINATGESGRISIAPFTTDTPLTTRTLSDDSSPKIISTSPYTEDKLISTQYTTKPVFDSTTPLNPNIIEDTVTESLLTTIPIELSTTETVAEVSQPRPFGFPRRTRPTTAASITHDTAQSTLTRIESTSKPKVSTHSRNIARSTTKAPRNRSRTRTRSREKLITSVDDEHLSLKDEVLQDNFELQYTQNIEAVSTSRSTNLRRGNSRFKPQNTAHSGDLSIKKNIDKDQTINTETTRRRHRRPLKATTTSDVLIDAQTFSASADKPLRNRNYYRTSRIREEKQSADTINKTQTQTLNTTQALKSINFAEESKNLTNLYETPTTESNTEKTDTYADDTKATMQTEESNAYSTITEGITESTRFIIEVTEPLSIETTINSFEDETSESIQPLLPTTTPSILWNFFTTTTKNSEDAIQTTIFDASTENMFENLSTAALNNKETTLSAVNQKTRKILLRKRPSTTPNSIEQTTQNDINSRRRKIVRRLRPSQNTTLNLNANESTRQGTSRATNEKLRRNNNIRNINDNNENKKLTSSALYSSTAKSVNQRHFIRKTAVTPVDYETSTLTLDVSDNVNNKRKSVFNRYRSTSLLSTNQPDNIINFERIKNEENHKIYNLYDNSDRINFSETSSKNTHRSRKFRFENENFEGSKGILKENAANAESTDFRRSRNRLKYKENDEKEFENFTFKNKNSSRYVPKTTSTTESSVQETLIPTKKFDYYADAIKRGNQLRTTPKFNTNEPSLSVSTFKPAVTRLVTSIVESATTERQKISIKKKYSSLTSTTFIPKTTTISNNLFLRKKELQNEIPNGFSTERNAEWSTLPIESEFADKKFTTQSSVESSTIEIESVFSNLIGH